MHCPIFVNLYIQKADYRYISINKLSIANFHIICYCAVVKYMLKLDKANLYKYTGKSFVEILNNALSVL